MSEITVAKRYAKSFLDLSLEKNCLEASYADMQQLLHVCNSNKDFRLMLKNPLIHHDKKSTILEQLFSSRLSALSMAFIGIIVRKKRELYLEHIAAEFISEYKQFKGIATAIVVSAKGLDDQIRKEITAIVKNVTKSEVELEERLNPEIIGGFVLRFGDIQYDSTVARSLKMLKLNFSQNLYENKVIKK